ncbi:MAG: ATP-dependent 6-phosphofructokinase [Chloroflexi bacterium]|nr:ATP-dependent 6-phosphofructokinase [Chloroflexota bacterium]
MKIGLLTGGGDSCGINAAIRAVVIKAADDGHTVVGIRNGWAGVLESWFSELTPDMVATILPRGGTMLGTSRTNPFRLDGAVEKLQRNVRSAGLDAIVAIGGDDTLGVAHRINLLEEPVHAVGVPQTIDNDISETDYAIGFHSAVEAATNAVDMLTTTAESHSRIMVIEVMGRDAGHVALAAGVAGGADLVLVPEHPLTIEEVVSLVKKRRDAGKTFSLIVVAEGAKPKGAEQVTISEKVDAFGHVRLGGVADYLANHIEDQTGFETRSMNLGHLQRGGTSTPFDRLLASQFGYKAVEMVEAREFDRMVAIQGNRVVSVRLEDAIGRTKPVDEELFRMATDLFKFNQIRPAA